MDTSGTGPQLIVAPSLMDIHLNGWAGVHFGNPDLTSDQVRQLAEHQFAIGVTQFLPTVNTDSAERTAAALSRLRQVAEEPDLAPAIAGFHMEGPYLSADDGPRGAHPQEHCRDPDWDEFRRLQDAAGGKIRLLTLAPERAGAVSFIEKAVDSGVRIAIGHTAATRAQIRAAVDAGATLATHLGNGAHDQLQRHHNYIYDLLGDDRLSATLIVDGHHLPPNLVKIFCRVKGTDRTILISDAVQYAGLPPGVYDAGYRQFQVRDDGFIGVVGEPRLAGSGLHLARGVENLVRFTDWPLADALRCASQVPASYLGLDHRLGRLEPGAEASMVLLSWDSQTQHLTVAETVLAGRTVFSKAEG